MTWTDAFISTEQDHKAQVMRETWGHLAPKKGEVYPGYMIFTLGDYGDFTIIKSEFDNLEDSPWFYQDMNDFMVKRAKEKGRVYRFVGTYRKLKNGHGAFSGDVTLIKLPTKRAMYKIAKTKAKQHARTLSSVSKLGRS